jgi:hypothetical protein
VNVHTISYLRWFAALHAGHRYNEMWMQRKEELAQEVLTPGFVSRDFITGRVMDGREATIEMIRQV